MTVAQHYDAFMLVPITCAMNASWRPMHIRMWVKGPTKSRACAQGLTTEPHRAGHSRSCAKMAVSRSAFKGLSNGCQGAASVATVVGA